LSGDTLVQMFIKLSTAVHELSIIDAEKNVVVATADSNRNNSHENVYGAVILAMKVQEFAQLL